MQSKLVPISDVGRTSDSHGPTSINKSPFDIVIAGAKHKLLVFGRGTCLLGSNETSTHPNAGRAVPDAYKL